jgi:hypothetical protein
VVKERYEMPVPVFAFDRTNNFDGKTLFFWGVANPSFTAMLLIGWAKVGKWGEPGVLVKSQAR